MSAPQQLLAKIHCLCFIASAIAPVGRLYNVQEIMSFRWFGETIGNRRSIGTSHSAVLACPPTSFDLAKSCRVRTTNSVSSSQARSPNSCLRTLQLAFATCRNSSCNQHTTHSDTMLLRSPINRDGQVHHANRQTHFGRPRPRVDTSLRLSSSSLPFSGPHLNTPLDERCIDLGSPNARRRQTRPWRLDFETLRPHPDHTSTRSHSHGMHLAHHRSVVFRQPRRHPRFVPNAKSRSFLDVLHRSIGQQDVFHGGFPDCALQSRRVVAGAWYAAPCNPHQAATDAHQLITLRVSHVRLNLHDMLALRCTCPQNVLDVSRDRDHHDASDGEAVESIEDGVFCEAQCKQHSSDLPT